MKYLGAWVLYETYGLCVFIYIYFVWWTISDIFNLPCILSWEYILDIESRNKNDLKRFWSLWADLLYDFFLFVLYFKQLTYEFFRIIKHLTSYQYVFTYYFYHFQIDFPLFFCCLCFYQEVLWDYFKKITKKI